MEINSIYKQSSEISVIFGTSDNFVSITNARSQSFKEAALVITFFRKCTFSVLHDISKTGHKNGDFIDITARIKRSTSPFYKLWDIFGS